MMDEMDSNPTSNFFRNGVLSTLPGKYKSSTDIDCLEKYNVKINWVPFYEEFANYRRRLNTFDTWPKQMNPKPDDLTQAGFFYGGVSDTVYCFFCGKGIHCWELHENAFEEHKKWSPNCGYLNMICDM